MLFELAVFRLCVTEAMVKAVNGSTTSSCLTSVPEFQQSGHFDIDVVAAV